MAGSNLSNLLFAGLGRTKSAVPTKIENPLFDRDFYAEHNPFVVKGGIDLYTHYSHFGCRNGYDPNAFFGSAWYLAANPDVAASGADPLDHYLEKGVAEGRDPSPAFSTWLYLLLYPDVRTTGINPLLHYIRYGRDEGRLAPPPCLLPSVSVMQGRPGDADIARVNEVRPLLDLARRWSEQLSAAQRG